MHRRFHRGWLAAAALVAGLVVDAPSAGANHQVDDIECPEFGDSQGSPVTNDVVEWDVPDGAAGAIELSRRAGARATTAVLASASSVADALVAAPVASMQDAPLLFTSGASLDSSIVAELRRLGVTDVDIVGGDAAVPPSISQALAALGIDVRRLAGADRFATAVAASKLLFAGGSSTAIVANASSLPDAISASSLAAALQAPVLLATTTRSAEDVRAEVVRLDAEHVIAVGGEAVLNQVHNYVPDRSATYYRLTTVAGTDRYSTLAAANNMIFSNATNWPPMEGPGNEVQPPSCSRGLPVETALVVPGALVATDLAAAPAAARLDAAVVLAGHGCSPLAALNELFRLNPTQTVLAASSARLEPEDLRTACPERRYDGTLLEVPPAPAWSAGMKLHLMQNTRVLRWNPCRTLEFRLDPNLTDDYRAASLEAMRQVIEASGLEFVETPYMDPDHDFTGITFTIDDEGSAELGTRGYGAWASYGNQVMGATVGLLSGMTGDELLYVTLHELGHVMGLGHGAGVVGHTGGHLTSYTAADRAGLYLLGSSGGCNPVTGAVAPSGPFPGWNS